MGRNVPRWGHGVVRPSTCTTDMPHVNNSRIVESAGNDTSSAWHVDGVGEALVFTLKTSLQLKTGGLVYRPVSGALTKSKSKSTDGESKSTQGVA